MAQLLARRTRSFGTYSVKRNPVFSQVKDQDVNYFEGLLGTTGMSLDSEEIAPHNIDWTKKFQGNSSVLLKPKTTE